MARGDRRIAQVIEDAWRAGARFDGWDEVFDLALWQRVLAARGVDQEAYFATRPVTARLPWDHIDVGLEDGFLLGEYRRALAGRASPPCGKVAGQLIHHTNLEDADPDHKRLVCYDCGVACDLTQMREERLVALKTLGATTRPIPLTAVPKVNGEMLDVSERGGGSPAEHDREASRRVQVDRSHRAKRVEMAGYMGADAPFTTYRIRFAKVGRASFLGHLDLGRLLSRTFRRADLALAMSRGFSPKPRISFGPALGLGVPSLGEVIDVDLEHAPMVDGRFVRFYNAPDDAPRTSVPPDEVFVRMSSVCPEGIVIESVERVAPLTGSLGKRIAAVDLVLAPAPDGMAFDARRLTRIVAAFMARADVPVMRISQGKPDRSIDVRALVMEASVIEGADALRLAAAFDWTIANDSPALIRVRVRADAEGSARPIEVAKAFGVWGSDDPRGEHAQLARLGVVMGSEIAPKPNLGRPRLVVAVPDSASAS